MNTRVRKHNLRGSKNNMNVIVRDVRSFNSGTYTTSVTRKEISVFYLTCLDGKLRKRT